MIILLITVIIILVLISNTYLKPQFTVDDNGSHTTMTAYFFMKSSKIKRQLGPGGIRKPGREKGRNDPVKKHGFLEIYDEYVHVKEFYNSAESTIKYILKKADIEEINIVAVIGTNDACLTALSVGFACTLAGILVSAIDNIINKCKKNIRIIPDFSGDKIYLNLYGIFKTKTVYIIVAIMKYLTYLVLRKVKTSRNKQNEQN